MARGSRAIAKMRLESGHPCFVPLYSQWNGEDIMPLYNTDAIGSMYNNLIHAKNVGPKPHLFSV